jgi:hypothetical protein
VFELQRLHGIGEGILPRGVENPEDLPRVCAGGRAPRLVGLPGVRQLAENGANCFVHQAGHRCVWKR